MTLAPGTRIGPYDVVARLGAGGMGEVYRATDSRLGRQVAVKILLQAAHAGPDAVERFEREARLLASINHPNIATLYGVETHGGLPVIVMELAGGPSLEDLIAQGPLELATTARIACQIADGLASAHARGIVHRDLKPSNVRMTPDDRVKILDFGLAKGLTPAANARTGDGTPADAAATIVGTRVGTILGTPAYMSPEQAVGAPVDARSDVWAFGAVLFEMLSGRRAFAGATTAEVIGSVLRGAVAWEALPASVPREVRALIEQCLAREPGRRMSDLGQVRDLLQPLVSRAASRVSASATATKSIVVLPFANLSPDPDSEYFSDGLTDEIITDLSRVRALRVISRSSAMRLKGGERDLATIGRDLACQYALEGSVRRASNSLRITARLVDLAEDTQLWAEKYGGSLDDVFDIQERVSRSIVDALEIRLTPQEAAQMGERPITDVHAQECYLRARGEIWSFLPGSLERAISHLETALRLVGENALIYQGLGEAYFQSVNIGTVIGREEEYIRQTEWCADRIFAFEPDSPRGHLVRANAQLARGDVHACALSLRRVLQVFPNEVSALMLYVHVLGWLAGRPDAAAPLAARVVSVDPLNAASLLVSAMVPLFAGRFAEAVELARRMFALDPVTPVWRANYAMALLYNQQIDEAESLTAGVTAHPDSDVGTWQIGLQRAAWRRDRAEVLRLAGGPHRQTAAWDAEVPWILASAHAAVGARDEALHWLDRAIDGGMINYPFLAEHDRLLDPIREDARFAVVLARARREWESFEA